MLEQLRSRAPSQLDVVINHVWSNKDSFVKWPQRSFLFMPGVLRINYHYYSIEQKLQIKYAGLKLDSRSNGPAIMAFLLAGGTRPDRIKPGKQWSIHHIYDGCYPAPGKSTTVRAVADGRYFTEAAGLVAIHPVADSLADEVPYFAWLLRNEANERFGFDPDGVFIKRTWGHILQCSISSQLARRGQAGRRWRSARPGDPRWP